MSTVAHLYTGHESFDDRPCDCHGVVQPPRVAPWARSIGELLADLSLHEMADQDLAIRMALAELLFLRKRAHP